MNPPRATTTISTIEADIKELHDAVLGYNGSVPGLVTNVAILTEKVIALGERLEDLSKNGCLFGRTSGVHRAEVKEVKEAKKESDAVTFRYLTSTFFLPAVIALIASGTTVILTHFLK